MKGKEMAAPGITLSAAEKRRFRDWIVTHVDETLVPTDEGNAEGLIYNLVQAVYGTDERYAASPEYPGSQDEAVTRWQKLAYDSAFTRGQYLFMARCKA